MDVADVKKYEGKTVLLILSNNFKLTIKIPKFEGSTFTAKDRYGNSVTVECNMISMIYEKKEDEDG